MLMDWSTTALPSLTMRLISASGTPRGSVSFRFHARSVSSRARFLGAEMYTARKGFPIVVGPIFTTFTRGLCLARRL